MSLGGLAVAVGLIIDDAVVVIENINHQLQSGLTPGQAVLQALKELTAPVISSTLTTVVVFAPLGLLSGVAGQFFTSFTITLTAAVFFSLLLSLSLIPTVCAQALKAPTAKPRTGASLSDRWYSNTLRFTFKQPLVLFAFYAVLLGSIAFIVPHLGTDFLPVVDEGSYMLDYLAPAGSSLSETDSVARILEQILKRTPEVVAFTRRTGAESDSQQKLTRATSR